MAHELHDDGFHEIQLSGKQLVFLFMATTVVSIVIFLCGVLVGRGVQGGRATIAEAVGLGASALPGDEEESASAPSSGEPTPVPGLSYPANLADGAGQPARVEPGAADGMATTTPEPVAPVKDARPASPPPATAAVVDAARLPEAKPAVAPPPSTAPAPAEDGGFTVQVTALKSRPEADAIAQRLQTRGYKAYVVAPGAGGQVIYKVRVGVNMQRQDADTVMRRLQSEEKFKPWITR